MALDTSTNVEKIDRVQNGNGKKVPPASDAYGSAQEATGVDLIASGRQLVQPTVPDRASKVVVFADFSAAGHIEVAFQDSSGSEISRRTPTQNGNYSVSGAGQVFVEVAIPSEKVAVLFYDDSGGTSNTTTWGVRTE